MVEIFEPNSLYPLMPLGLSRLFRPNPIYSLFLIPFGGLQHYRTSKKLSDDGRFVGFAVTHRKNVI
jgi:hypothetical protein